MRFKALTILLAGAGLAACNAFGGGSPTPLPTLVLGDTSPTPQSQGGFTGSGVTASGVVAPAQQAQMVFALAGKVQAVNVAVGDTVQAGDALANLAGSEKLAAEVDAANLEVLSAQQALDDLSMDMDVRLAEALQTIADNRDAVRDAERSLYNLQTQAPPVDIDAVFANLVLARDKLDRARKDYEPYENKPTDNVIRAGYLSQLAQAQKEYDDLVRQYNNLLGTANEIDLSQAQAELATAQADLAKAQRDYESLQKGPDPEEVKLAEARLATAKSQLAAAQSALEDLDLRAPFAGTVTTLDLHPGEWVTPGQVVLGLADLSDLQVETTDLSERDIPKVEVGQPVSVFVKALGQEVAGRVTQIAPLADTLGGDVVYKTTIELETLPEGLRAGMSVEVQFGISQ